MPYFSQPGRSLNRSCFDFFCCSGHFLPFLFCFQPTYCVLSLFFRPSLRVFLLTFTYFTGHFITRPLCVLCFHISAPHFNGPRLFLAGHFSPAHAPAYYIRKKQNPSGFVFSKYTYLGCKN